MVRDNRVGMANRTGAEKVDAVRVGCIVRQNINVQATACAKAVSTALATIGCGVF